MRCPFSDSKVNELDDSVAAPYAGLTFAALGADVIQIERPGKGKGAAS